MLLWPQPLPEKFVMKGMVERFNDDFIETRKKALHRFLNRISEHPILSYSQHFKVFLTAQVSFSHSHTHTRTHRSVLSDPENSETWNTHVWHVITQLITTHWLAVCEHTLMWHSATSIYFVWIAKEKQQLNNLFFVPTIYVIDCDCLLDCTEQTHTHTHTHTHTPLNTNLTKIGSHLVYNHVFKTDSV